MWVPGTLAPTLLHCSHSCRSDLSRPLRPPHCHPFHFQSDQLWFDVVEAVEPLLDHRESCAGGGAGAARDLAAKPGRGGLRERTGGGAGGSVTRCFFAGGCWASSSSCSSQLRRAPLALEQELLPASSQAQSCHSCDSSHSPPSSPSAGQSPCVSSHQASSDSSSQPSSSHRSGGGMATV